MLNPARRRREGMNSKLQNSIFLVRYSLFILLTLARFRHFKHFYGANGVKFDFPIYDT